MAKNYEEEETKDEKDFIEEEFDGDVEELTDEEKEEKGGENRYLMDCGTLTRTEFGPQIVMTDVIRSLGSKPTRIVKKQCQVDVNMTYSDNVFVIAKKRINTYGLVELYIYGYHKTKKIQTKVHVKVMFAKKT